MGSPISDEEDHDTPFDEMGAQQLAEKTAWMKLFIREARKRGYTIEDIITLLDKPGMTVEQPSSGFCLIRPPSKAGVRLSQRPSKRAFVSG